MINTFDKSHIGHLPVRVLQHNIFATFESVNSNFQSYCLRVIEEKQMCREIGYTKNLDSCNGNKLIGPHVKIKERQIYVDETFLAYLWCVLFDIY